MQALSGLAKRGHTVVASLHQPRGSVFSLCDDVMLLADGGRPLYFGRAAEAVAHFEACLGVTKPGDVTAAEWLSDLSAIDTSSPEAEQASRKRVDSLVAAWAAKAQTSATSGSGGAAHHSGALVHVGPQLSWPAQFALLLRRSWRQVTRDKAGLVSRLGSTLSSALIFSSVYWRLNHSQAAIQSRLGLLQVAAVSTTMTSLMKTLTTFSKERRIVARERSGGAYALAPYFCAKLAAELPVSAVFPALFGALVYPCAGLAPGLGKLANFLVVTTLESFTSSAIGMAISALVPTTQAALATGPAVAVVFIVFGGSWTSQSTVPAFLRWLPNVSLIKQAFEALCVNELSGATFDVCAPGDAASGEVVLRRIGFEASTLGSANAQQARIMLANWGLAYAILASRAPRYAQPEEGPL
jgi:ABC-type multidrug transport system permease subunit